MIHNGYAFGLLASR